VLLLGLFVVLAPRGGDATRVPQVASGDSALAAALDRTDRADNLVATEPDAALDFYREAWAEVVRARNTGLSAPALDDLERRVRRGLDRLYLARTPVTERITALPRQADPLGLIEGPRGGAYYIDRADSTVSRVNTSNGKSATIVHEGDTPAAGGSSRIGVPVQLEAGGPDVVIVDDQARPWRWRPSNSAGSGTLNRLTLQGSPTFGEDHGDVAAYSPSTGGYRLYVAEPSRNQIMRYQQTLDGSAFSPPSTYLATPSSEVADFTQIYVDFDVYALLDNTLRRYRLEKYDGGFALDEPPDGEDVRPGHDYRLVAGSGSASSGGRVYLYDALHARVVGFEKAEGSYLGQWAPAPDEPQMDDVRGMYVIPGKTVKKKRDPDTLVWITPEGVFSSVLATSG
jgi:WD40 repeat protein